MPALRQGNHRGYPIHDPGLRGSGVVVLNKLLLPIIAFFSGIILCCLFPVSGQAGDLYGVFSFSGGMVCTHDDATEAFNLDERFEAGVSCEAAKPSWPVVVIASYTFSYGNSRTRQNPYDLPEHRDTDVYCTETCLGIKKTMNWYPGIKPYLAGGFSSVSMYVDITSDDDYDDAFGTWYGAGAGFMLTKDWRLSLGWRRSRAKLKLFGNRLDTGGDHFDLSIGYRFPRQ